MKSQPSPHATPILHPYVRISHPEQRKGGGLERQTSADVSGFAERFGFAVSKRIRVDDGVSAFHGLNATPEHELGQFLDEAKRGLIRPGDCLLIENYDRLSREDPWAAIGLVSDLRDLGIHVGRLDRMKLMRCDSTDVGDFFEAAMEFVRGHSESVMKSYRNCDKWAKKRKAALEKGETITATVPAWVKIVDGRREAIPEKVAAIRRAIELLTAGYGLQLTGRQLTEENVKGISKSGRWSRSYLLKLASDRRLLGEFQPRLTNDAPAGEPIKGYYPAVLNQKEFYALRAAICQRTRRKGRITERVELFSRLIKNARDGRPYYVSTRSDRGVPYRVLINAVAADEFTPLYSFPSTTFEKAVLSCLKEIDPAEIIGAQSGANESVALGEEFAALEARAEEVEAEMAKGNIPSFAKVLRRINDEKEAVAERLATAKQNASNPLGESWGQCKSLIDAIETSPNPTEARVRLRKAINRIVDEMWILVVPKGRTRLCAVQMRFTEGKGTRDYLIIHRAAKANAKGRLEGSFDCRSLTQAGVNGQLDMRISAHVQEVLRVLDETDLR